MTKLSAIMVCPTVALRSLPDAERDVLRRFFTQHVRGMDSKHDKRFRRFVKDLFNAAPGEGFQLYLAKERGGPFHRRHRAILKRLFDSQEVFDDEDLLHDFIKLRCWFVTFEEGPRTGNPIPKPRSTAFDKCSDDEMREFHEKAIALLHKPWVQRRFWPHLTPPMRQQMLDSVLADPKEQEQ